MAGAIDREAPVVGGSGITQSAQAHGGAVGQDAVNVAERAVVADGDAGQVRPAFAGLGGQALGQEGLGGVGIARHENHLCWDGVSRRVPVRGCGTKIRCRCPVRT